MFIAPNKKWKVKRKSDRKRNYFEQQLEYTPESGRIPWAPVFYPTAKEFLDPIAYVESIRERAEPYGLCKIVPPKEYDLRKQSQSLADIGVNENNFLFKTKIQSINDLQFRAGNPKPPPAASPIKSSSISTSPITNKEKRKLPIVAQNAKRRKFSSSYKTQQMKEQQDDNDQNGNDEEDDEVDEDAANFGFERKKEKISLRKFRKQANQFKKKFFKGRVDNAKMEDAKFLAPNSTTTIRNRILPRPLLQQLARRGGKQRVQSVTYYDDATEVTDGDIESEYWRIVERVDPTMNQVQVEYGSDLFNTPIPDNSCFPKNWKCNWGGSKLAVVDNSMLKYLYMNVPGITSPMLYVGMMFSSFCWHVEDHFLYAFNYLHYGANKTWYGIPGSAAQKFEKLARAKFPGLFSINPKILECLVTMINPRLLIDNDVPVYRMTHEPGTYMITFPRAYHAGFNHGFNFAESTNFAPGSWIPWGRICSEKYYSLKRPSAFSQEQVCLTALHHLEEFAPSVRNMIRSEVVTIIGDEFNLRAKLKEKEIVKTVEMPNTKKNPHLSRKASIQKDNKVCFACKQDCYFSAVLCATCYESTKRTIKRGGDIEDPNKYLCLRCVLSDVGEWESTCDHKKDKFCMLIRYTDDKLREFLNYAKKGE